MKINKTLLETILIIFIGLVITIFYFKPLVFEDKTLIMHDASQAGYGSKELRDFREQTGTEAIWTGREFSGMPLYLTGTHYNSNLTYKIHRFFAFLPQGSEVIFLSFLGAFLLLLSLKINPFVAGVSAFAYGFNTFNIVSTEAGHILKIFAIAYTPIFMAGIALVFRKKYLLGTATAILGLTLALGSKHYQIIYYFIFFGSIFGVYEVIKTIMNKEYSHLFKTIGLLSIAILIAAGPHVSTIWSTQEYSKYSIRGEKELTPMVDSTQILLGKKAESPKSGLDKDYAFAWSQGKWESFTLLIPYLYGGASQEIIEDEPALGYWGKQPGTAGPIYAGAIIFFLFMMYLVNIKKIQKYWILAGGVLMLFIAWGKNLEWFNYFMFDYFPMFNKFRSVSMAMTFVMLALIIGAAFGLNYFLNQEKEDKIKTLKYSAISFFGLTILVFLITKMTGNFGYFTQELPDEYKMKFIEIRKQLLWDSTLKVLFLNAIVAIVLWLHIGEKVSKNIAISIVGLLLVIDLVSIDTRYLNYDSFDYKEEENHVLVPTNADKEIMKDQSHYRVFDLDNPFNNANPSYFHNSIGGYDAVKIQRYQDLIERHISVGNVKVLSMLNTKYVINEKDQAQQTNFDLGPAWFVSKLEKVKNADEENAFLNNEQFIPSKNAVVDDSKFKINTPDSLPVGSIKLESYKPNQLIYKTENTGKGIAVFSEVYYPAGWIATIDGKESSIFRVNYILRAMEIPAGKHTVEFNFRPKSFYEGEKYAKIFSILLIIVCAGAFGFEIYQNVFKKDKNAVSE
jgi:hypothetical protein